MVKFLPPANTEKKSRKQRGSLAIGHNLNALLLLVLLMFSLGGIAWIFHHQVTLALDQMHDVLRLAATH